MDKDKREWFEYLAGGGGGDFTDEHCELAKDALREIDRLATELKLAKSDRCVLDRAGDLLIKGNVEFLTANDLGDHSSFTVRHVSERREATDKTLSAAVAKIC